MKLTTKDIIKILPIENVVREDLLTRLDSLNDDVKFEVEQLVWRAYDAIYTMHLEANIERGLENIKNGKGKLTNDFYAHIKKQTEEELVRAAYVGAKSSDLDDIRAKLQNLMA